MKSPSLLIKSPFPRHPSASLSISSLGAFGGRGRGGHDGSHPLPT